MPDSHAAVGAPQSPLHGLRVIDVSRVISGPLCALLLGQLGAEVIRIEKPGGDISWAVPPFIGPDGTTHDQARAAGDISLGHAKRNFGKRSVELDITTESGRERFRGLALTADVLVENFRPSVMPSLGLGHEELRSSNPSLIYCSITGYGHSGPYRDRHGMDLLVQAASGVMAMTGFPDGPPVKAGVYLGDHVPAVYAVVGILAALRQRDRTKKGGFVDVSMHDVLTAMLWDAPLDVWQAEGRAERTGNTDPRGAPVNAYPTADGWIAILVMDDDRFRALCGEIGSPGLADTCQGLRGRALNAEVIDAAMTRWSSRLTTASALDRLVALDCPAAPVNPPWAGPSDPHTAARGVLGYVAHHAAPAPTAFRAARLPIKFDTLAVSGDLTTEPLGFSTESFLGDRDARTTG